ncbi:AI-2E family transporter [Streptomyces sp. NPDC058464]|uniref:AI-2E family transporter n=1 Tax=Streptomyces sp. NPDC058464 TaxID=3346511 RepID=UPI003655BFE0
MTHIRRARRAPHTRQPTIRVRQRLTRPSPRPYDRPADVARIPGRSYAAGPRPLLPDPVRRLGAWSAVALLVTGVVAVAIWLCVTFQTAVTPVLLALLGSALLGPLYRRMVSLKVNRSLAAGLTCAAVVLVVGGSVTIVVSALIDTGDQIVASLRDAAQSFSGRSGTAGASLDDLAKTLRSLLSKFGGTAASGLMSGVSVVSDVVTMGVLALLLVFFFLRDSDRALATMHSLSPARSAHTVEAMCRRAFQAIEGYMRGTTLIAFIDALSITVGLLVLRVPGALGLGALVFVGAYIPYLGAFLSGAVAVLVAFADRGWVTALWALGVVLLVQVIEGNVLQPMVHSRTVQMHPAVVMLAITAGATVAGVIGMLLAVPLTAAAFGVVSEIRARYTA